MQQIAISRRAWDIIFPRSLAISSRLSRPTVCFFLFVSFHNEKDGKKKGHTAQAWALRAGPKKTCRGERITLLWHPRINSTGREVVDHNTQLAVRGFCTGKCNREVTNKRNIPFYPIYFIRTFLLLLSCALFVCPFTTRAPPSLILFVRDRLAISGKGSLLSLLLDWVWVSCVIESPTRGPLLHDRSLLRRLPFFGSIAIFFFPLCEYLSLHDRRSLRPPSWWWALLMEV